MTGTSRIAPRNLGPLVPGQRSPGGQEALEQLVCVGAAPDPNQRTQDPDLERRIIVPVDPAATALAQAAQVFVESPFERAWRKALGCVGRGNRGGGGSRIEVGPLDRAGDVR